MNPPGAALDELVAQVQAARKYRSVAPDVIRSVGQIELARRRTSAEAVKATKRKLHQIAGSYLPAGLETGRWREQLCGSCAADPHATYRNIMSRHLSTRERLPFLEEFYHTLLGDIGPIRSVLDIGCGLNPLALPWMPVSLDCSYHAYDIYEDLAAMLGVFFAQIGRKGRAEARDVLHSPPKEAVDVALLLKFLPCVDQVDRNAGERLIHALNARVLVVSFPLHSLGGRRDKGMEGIYESRFRGLAEGQGWGCQRFIFPTELAFRVVLGCDKAGRDASRLPAGTAST
ncbi:MAG: 16S rRNA methyltransferase [Candidatus Eisenbacteria bacterium]|nr:16S rRNA methyltransferase [Candidatus Eisenbacteria bacterium]